MTVTYPDGETAMRPASNKQPIPGGPRRQQGFATLFVSVILLVAITLITFTNARTSLVETQMTNNEYRAVESTQAAEAALAYGVVWYEKNASSVTWVAGASADEETGGPYKVPSSIDAGNGDTYTMSVAYSRNIANTDIDDYVLVTATAEAQSDSSIQATTSQYVLVSSTVGQQFYNGPPLLMNGCMSGVVGGPQLFPRASDGIAAATTQPDAETWGSGTCLDKGHFTVHDDPKGNKGQAKGEFFGPGFTGSLWDRVFSMSKAQMKATSDVENAANIPYSSEDRTVVWYEDSKALNSSGILGGGKNIGGPGNPVIVIMSNPGGDCPKINGGITIYGIVFFDAQHCTANGWGGATIYGSTIFDGDMESFNANGQLRPWDEVGNPSDFEDKYAKAAMLPGTWRDF